MRQGSGKRLSLALKLAGGLFLLAVPVVYILRSGRLPASDEAVGLWIIAAGIASMALPVDISKIIEAIRGGKQ